MRVQQAGEGEAKLLKPSPLGGKVAPQGRMRASLPLPPIYGQYPQGFPLISQRAGPLTASPWGEAIPPDTFFTYRRAPYELLSNCFLFFAYSFLGWVGEVLFTAVVHRKYQDAAC